MRASPNYSRRRFLRAGTAGVAATVVAAATTPVRAAAEAGHASATSDGDGSADSTQTAAT